jgi:transcriptional regulator with XRE-family HTH domain
VPNRMATQIRSAMVADVGARIRSLRTAKGLTQAQLAEPLYTKAYISMLESGRTRASMKALEHIAGVLGVKPSDLLGGTSAPSTPQFQFLEARRLLEDGHAAEAVPILESLEEGLNAADQLVRLRYLAIGYNATSQPKQAFPVIERAQRMADLLGNAEEQVRIKAVLAGTHSRTFAYDEAIRLLKECILACDNGVVKDAAFHFRRLVDLAMALTNGRDSKQALVMYERALELAEGFADRPSMAALYAGMAKTYQNDGDLEAAINYNTKSLQLYEELGLMHQVACTLDNAALLYAEYGNRERARDCLARATVLAKETKRMGTLASIQTSEAEVTAKTDPEAGLLAAQEALKFAKKIDQPDAQIRALTLIGELKMTSSPAVAKRSFQEASQLAEERAPQLLRVIFDRWSRAAEARGDGDEALRLARRALETIRT